MIINRLHQLTRPTIDRLTQLYLLCLMLVSFLAGVMLLTGSSDGIKNQLNGLGLLGITLGFVVMWRAIVHGKISSYDWLSRFFQSGITHPLLLIAFVVHILVYIFATSLSDANTPYIVFFWGAITSALSLAFYGIVRIHFVEPAQSEAANLSNRQLLQTVVIAGVVGFIIGYLHPNLHVAVEQGQVLAGTIRYDIHNPWYMYQAKLWNFWAQFSAFGLTMGVSEMTLSMVISGIAGMLFSIGVAIIGLSITRKTLIAVMLPFIVLWFLGDGALLDRLQDGYGYPLMLIGFHHTYGMLGMSYMVLVLAMMMTGKHRVGFFLLGFSLMIHPSLSIWTHLALLIYVLSDSRHLWDWIKKGLFVVFGYAISVGSLIWQRATFPIPPLELEIEQRYLDAITTNFATHGGYDLIFDTVEGRFLAVVFVLCIGLLMFIRLQYSIKTGLKLIVIIIGIGVLGNLFAHLPNYLADLVTVLLPNRYLNMVAYLFIPIVIASGIAGLQSIYPPDTRQAHRLSSGLAIMAILIIGVSMYQFIGQYDAVYQTRFGYFDSPAFVAARESDDKLLVYPSERRFRTTMIQMVTDRPLVLNPLALDSLPYTVEAGPASDAILDDLYGVDFFHAPDLLATARSGMNPAIDTLWKNRNTDDWQTLAEKYGFTQILAPQNMGLQLPIAAQNENGITLYQVPK